MMKYSPVIIAETKEVNSEYRPIFSCNNVLVKIPVKGNKYMRKDPTHEMEVKGKLVVVPSHFVLGFIFPGTKLIMYKHYYISEDFLGKTINATIQLFKKVYPDNRVQYILDIKPQSEKESQFELKIYTQNDKPNRNSDLGSLICLEGKAVGKIACKELPPRE